MVKIDVEFNDPRTVDFASSIVLTPTVIKRLEKACGDKFRSNIDKLFKTEGSSAGEPWAPWSDNYRKSRVRRQMKTGGELKILQFTGSMRNALVDPNSSDNLSESVGTGQVVTLNFGVKSDKEAHKIGWHGPGDLHNPTLPIRDAAKQTPDQLAEYEQIVVGILKPYFESLLRNAARLLRNGT